MGEPEPLNLAASSSRQEDIAFENHAFLFFETPQDKGKDQAATTFFGENEHGDGTTLAPLNEGAGGVSADGRPTFTPAQQERLAQFIAAQQEVYQSIMEANGRGSSHSSTAMVVTPTAASLSAAGLTNAAAPSSRAGATTTGGGGGGGGAATMAPSSTSPSYAKAGTSSNGSHGSNNNGGMIGGSGSGGGQPTRIKTESRGRKTDRDPESARGANDLLHMLLETSLGGNLRVGGSSGGTAYRGGGGGGGGSFGSGGGMSNTNGGGHGGAYDGSESGAGNGDMYSSGGNGLSTIKLLSTAATSSAASSAEPGADGGSLAFVTTTSSSGGSSAVPMTGTTTTTTMTTSSMGPGRGGDVVLDSGGGSNSNASYSYGSPAPGRGGGRGGGRTPGGNSLSAAAAAAAAAAASTSPPPSYIEFGHNDEAQREFVAHLNSVLDQLQDSLANNSFPAEAIPMLRGKLHNVCQQIDNRDSLNISHNRSGHAEDREEIRIRCPMFPHCRASYQATDTMGNHLYNCHPEFRPLFVEYAIAGFSRHFPMHFERTFYLENKINDMRSKKSTLYRDEAKYIRKSLITFLKKTSKEGKSADTAAREMAAEIADSVPVNFRPIYPYPHQLPRAFARDTADGGEEVVGGGDE